MFKRIALLLLLTMGLVACNRDNFSAKGNPNGGIDITVTATESEINTSLRQVLSQSGSSALRNPSIDLQDGQIAITGEVERQNYSGEYVNAEFVVTISVVDGLLSAQVTYANVEGWAADDTRITEINQRIAQALQGRAVRDNPNVTLTAVTITNDNLTFTLNAKKGGS